jgi:hypothetical protein
LSFTNPIFENAQAFSALAMSAAGFELPIPITLGQFSEPLGHALLVDFESEASKIATTIHGEKVKLFLCP